MASAFSSIQTVVTVQISMSKEPKSAAAPKIKIKGLAKSKGDFEEAMTQAPDEEHFILRLPPKLAEHIAPLVKKREVPQDISFSFNDSRTGTFKIGEQTFPTHLVDLPCITESLKTIDNKQFYKIADISQMLIVGSSVRVSADGIWPGIDSNLHRWPCRAAKRSAKK